MPTQLSPLDGPRAITDADFPQTGPTQAQLAAMLNWAVQAPSVLNTQPWRFHLQPDAVEVHVDRDRQLHSIDPDGREAVISCGAALATLRLVARHYGFAVVVSYAEPDAPPDLVATLRLAGPSRATSAEEVLYEAIKRRHTNRDPYADIAIPAALLTDLAVAASAEGARLHILAAPDDRATLATLVGEAVRVQRDDPATVAEFRTWLRPTGDRRADGVPDEVQGGWDRLSHLYSEARFLAAEAEQLAAEAPALFVVATVADTPADWVRAGQALQRVLLVGAARGLAASYFNQPTEVAALREQLAALLGGEAPQVVFRMGTPIEARGTPRRPVDDVLVRPA